MGFLERLFGTDSTEQSPQAGGTRTVRRGDETALERYRELLRTAPTETIEQVHREAFATLTDDERALIYEELCRGAQTGERPLSSEPATLARAATRAESRRPGTMERVLRAGDRTGGGQARAGGPSFGALLGSTLLGTVAGSVVGSALVSAFLPVDGVAPQAELSGDGDGDASGSRP
ncbi:MAG: hypothetical protein HY996_08385 [Micrococcales bacterium]|nr:hypothetical protein [Micrococcales bacterium]